MSDFHYHPNLDQVNAVHTQRDGLMSIISNIMGASFSSRPIGNSLGLSFAGLAALNGVVTLFSLLSGRYGDFAREGSLPHYLFHVCGYVAIGYGITAYFAASAGGGDGDASTVLREPYPPNAAIAYGLLPLLLFQARALLSGYFKRISRGRRNLPMLVTIAGSAAFVALMLMGEPADSTTFARAMSLGLGIRGLLWCALPAKTEKILYNVDIAEKDRQAIHAVGIELGQNMLTYAFLAGGLSFGATPLHSIGASSLVHTLLLFYNSSLSRTFAADKASPVPGRLYLAVSAFFALAFFLAIPFHPSNVPL